MRVSKIDIFECLDFTKTEIAFVKLLHKFFFLVSSNLLCNSIMQANLNILPLLNSLSRFFLFPFLKVAYIGT